MKTDLSPQPQRISTELMEALTIINNKRPRGLAGVVSAEGSELLRQASQLKVEDVTKLGELDAILDPVKRILACAYLYDRVAQWRDASNIFDKAGSEEFKLINQSERRRLYELPFQERNEAAAKLLKRFPAQDLRREVF